MEMKNIEIEPYKSKRHLNYILFIGVFSFISIALQGADAPIVTIGTIQDAVPGQLVTVPITVTGFANIGSFYLYLEYDYSKIQYSSLTKNPGLTGNYDINDIDLKNGTHRIIMSYSGGINGINLPDGSSIVDFVFNYTAGQAELKWNTSRDNYCKYTDPKVNKLNDSPKSSFYFNGEVSGLTPSAPVIDSITQPTYEISTGSVELTGLPSGAWTIDPGAIAGTGPSLTISDLVEGTYNFTVTNADEYTSAPSADVVINALPALDAGENGTLTICEGSTVTEAELFASLGGTPDAGGLWTPILAGAGTYTYTHAAVGGNPEATAQVVVDEKPVLNAGENGTLTIREGDTVSEAELFASLGGTPDAGGVWTPTLAGAGIYTYTLAAIGECPEAIAQVVVNAQPITAIGNIPLNDANGNQGLSLSNYPNPFRNNTKIKYTIPFDGKVSIKLFNHLGQQVMSLVDANQYSGEYSVDCNFETLKSGVYIARIMLVGNAENVVATIKLSVLD